MRMVKQHTRMSSGFAASSSNWIVGQCFSDSLFEQQIMSSYYFFFLFQSYLRSHQLWKHLDWTVSRIFTLSSYFMFFFSCFFSLACQVYLEMPTEIRSPYNKLGHTLFWVWSSSIINAMQCPSKNKCIIQLLGWIAHSWTCYYVAF